MGDETARWWAWPFRAVFCSDRSGVILLHRVYRGTGVATCATVKHMVSAVDSVQTTRRFGEPLFR
jgi:hypothetical protein